MPTQDEQLRIEQRAFDSMVGELLEKHEGQIVLFRDERPVGFFSSISEAFTAGVERFGLDGVFLISRIEPPIVGSAALTWDLAAL